MRPGARLKLAAALGLLLCATVMGCARPPRVFQVGIYSPPLEKLPAMREAGFNLVIGERSTDYLDAARKNDFKVIVPLDTFKASAAGPAEIKSLGKHPALLGWYLVDEPDLHEQSPALIQRKLSDLRKHSRKPAFIVTASGAALERYRDGADLLAFDWYPIPWAPLSTIHRELRYARLASGEKPFYAILQAFDWKAFPGMITADVPFRPPSAAELRCMSYLAFLNGAEGILFYTYQTRGWNLEEHPALWNSVRQLAGELRETTAALGERIRWPLPEIDYFGAPEEMYNEVFDGRIAAAFFSKKVGDQTDFYLLAINVSGEATDATVTLPVTSAEPLPVLNSDEVVVPIQGAVRREFDPFEVLIVGPLR